MNNNNFSNDVSGILKQKGIDPKNLKNMDKNALKTKSHAYKHLLFL